MDDSKGVDMGPSLFHGPHPLPNQPKQKPGHDATLPLALQPILLVSAMLPPTRLRHRGTPLLWYARPQPVSSGTPQSSMLGESLDWVLVLACHSRLETLLWASVSVAWDRGLQHRTAPRARLTHVVLHQVLHRVKLGPRRDVVATSVQLSDLVMLHVIASGLVPIPDGQRVGTCWEGSPSVLPQSGSRKRPKRLGTLELEGHIPQTQSQSWP